MSDQRDHGGGIDAAIAQFGGSRADWLDLSTGINPGAYPLPTFTQTDWAALPDHAAQSALLAAARRFWQVPDGADILAAPGASALIARIPSLWPAGQVDITARTYNEHAAAFRSTGWTVGRAGGAALVVVHPNNPDGALWDGSGDQPIRVIDESFCDVTPAASHIALSLKPDTIILKSFGKFWGLAGARLGFAIGLPETLAPLRDRIGPWAVAGPTLRIGEAALRDTQWAEATRTRLARDATRLDTLVQATGASIVGGTSLFRLYQVADAKRLQTHLAQHHILARIFPYSKTWIRLGLPGTETDWQHLTRALATGP